MKKINPITLKDAKVLSIEEMKLLFGGSAAKNSAICQSEGKRCTLMVQFWGSGYLPFTGQCKTLTSGAWKRCACVAGDYSSDPSKPSNACS